MLHVTTVRILFFYKPNAKNTIALLQFDPKHVENTCCTVLRSVSAHFTFAFAWPPVSFEAQTI